MKKETPKAKKTEAKIDVNIFKKSLEKELEMVEGELKTVGQRNPSNPADWEAKPSEIDVLASDMEEVADKIESYEENTGILKELEIRYNNIKDALARIKKGTYGKCKVCGKQIEAKRLNADSSAPTCIEHMK